MSNLFLQIDEDLTLSKLNEIVGSKNTSDVLNVNGLKRDRNIGGQYKKKCEDIVNTSTPVSWQRKSEILNMFSTDSDVFEHAAVQDENSWKVSSNTLSFPGFLKIPDTIHVPSFDDVLGNGQPVSKTVYTKTMQSLERTGDVDPGIFNEFSTIKNSNYFKSGDAGSSSLFQWFNIPWGDIVFYSQLSGDSIDIPVYPEQFSDGKGATYDQMDSTLYQYEPWYMYSSANGRSLSLEFKMHRHMWTGDESDGKANELIRFIQASLYPRYQGSSVISDTVTLYIKGSPLISGILTGCDVSWSGPIGIDGWYLEFSIVLTIYEVSTRPLNYDVIKSLPLIG